MILSLSNNFQFWGERKLLQMFYIRALITLLRIRILTCNTFNYIHYLESTLYYNTVLSKRRVNFILIQRDCRTEYRLSCLDLRFN